jgi:hypothetical protein
MNKVHEQYLATDHAWEGWDMMIESSWFRFEHLRIGPL